MGLVIKPRKCHVLSIESGKTVNVQYKLEAKGGNEVNISAVIDEKLKFLGSDVFGTNTPLAMFA